MSTAILWFRRDLRLANLATLAAAKRFSQIIPVYIHAPEEEKPWSPGAASCWWLHHSLKAFAESLNKVGSRLLIRHGPSVTTLQQLCEVTGATDIFCHRLYEPACIRRDHVVSEALKTNNITLHSLPGNLLFEPWAIKTKNATPYKVFTPFSRACLQRGLPDAMHGMPRRLQSVTRILQSESVDDLNLLPLIPWDKEFYAKWSPGENGAIKQLRQFIKQDLASYQQHRDFPDLSATSRLSAALHFGEITPQQIVNAINRTIAEKRSASLQTNAEAYLREILWREFTHHVLYHFPHTPTKPLDERFTDFPWKTTSGKFFKCWQQGKTGIPIVDAGMRELWLTGTMHNRVRMIVGSLLTKNGMHHWLHGAKWFWDTLLDADLAQNSFNWQWVAGCGADAAPYFRIFNPVTQSEKFDQQGNYIRRFVPELAKLPADYIHAPWDAPDEILLQAGIRLGKDYPEPVLDLKTTRQLALDAYQSWKK